MEEKIEEKQPKNGLAIASMVLGIATVICIFFVWTIVGGIIGILTGIIGIVLGIVVKKSGNTSGMATAGLVLSIIGLILCLISLIACVVVSAVLFTNYGYYNNAVNDIMSSIY